MLTWQEFLSGIRRWIPITAIALAAMAGRLLYLHQTHLHRADGHLAAGRYDEALWDYQWAIRHYVPGWPGAERALDGAQSVMDHWRNAGESEKTRQALRRVRGSLYAIRSFYQPFPERLAAVEDQLRDIGEPVGDESTD